MSQNIDVLDSKKRQFIRKGVINGSLWVLLGEGIQMALRVGGNLILTRLLFPELFGIMALVNIFIQGIRMFSDLGLSASIIQNPRGEEEAFSNTVWTVRFFRGVLVFILMYLIASPLSRFYGLPILESVVPVAGIVGLTEGLLSTKWDLCIRNVQIPKIIKIEIATQIVSLTFMVLLAWEFSSVWILVIGLIFGSAFRVACSHLVLEGPRNKFAIEWSALKEVIHYGKWIFLSTALTFLAKDLDRLILGKLMTIDLLGIFSIAFMICQAISQVITSLSRRVLFPSYSRLSQDHSAAPYRSRIRLAMIALMVPPILLLSQTGDAIIQFLLDHRYHAAGPILEVLSIGVVAQVLILTLDPILLAQGNSFRLMVVNAVKIVLLCICMWLGYLLGEVKGLIFGIALSFYATYPFVLILTRRYGSFYPGIDLAILILGLIFLFREL